MESQSGRKSGQENDFDPIDVMQSPSELEGKFLRKIKEDPFVPIGVLAMVATLVTGAYRYKTAKEKMSTSNFLMQLRVTAQSAVIGCISLGVVYNMIQNFFGTNKPAKKQ